MRDSKEPPPEPLEEIDSGPQQVKGDDEPDEGDATFLLGVATIGIPLYTVWLDSLFSMGADDGTTQPICIALYKH